MARRDKAARVVELCCFCEMYFLCSLLVFRAQNWPEQTRLPERLASIESCCFCYLDFVFSIGVRDTKVARTGKAARTAIFNRVIFFCYGVFCVLSLCFGRESDQCTHRCESGYPRLVFSARK